MDDLLDLDFASHNSKLHPSSSTSTGRSTPNPPYGKSTFDYLSSATSANGNGSTHLRPSTPSLSPSPSTNGSRPTTPAYASPNATGASRGLQTTMLPSRSSSGSTGDDAFSSLFGTSPSATAINGAGLSMAQRLAKDNAARGFGGGTATSVGSWTTLSPNITGGTGSRAASPALHPHAPSRGASVSTPASKSAYNGTSDPWDLDFLSSSSTSPVPPLPASSANRKPSTNHAVPTSPDPFDLSFDEPPKLARSPPPHPPKVAKPDSSSFSMLDDDAFDRRNQEGLLGSGGGGGYGSDSDEDILGALSKPVSAQPAPSHRPTQRQLSPHSDSHSRTVSPPPHILGQIVEMGFSIPQAKLALLATKGPSPNDWRVESALEALVEESQVNESQVRRGEEERRSREIVERTLRESPTTTPPQVAVQQPTPTRPTTGRRAREAAAKQAAEDAATSASKQAQDLLAQASKIGFSVFKSANAYWETGRATIQKAIDEKMEGTSAAGGSNGAGGEGGKQRPKWMTDDFVEEGEEAQEIPQARARPREQASSGGRGASKQKVEEREPTPPLFQDSDPEDPVLPSRPTKKASLPQTAAPPTSSSSRLAPQPQPAAAMAPSSSNGGYQSPWRRAKSGNNTPETTSRSHTPSPRPSPSPKPIRPPRPFISISPSQLSQSSSHKQKGNEFFKLGQFGDAEISYSAAIQSLPDNALVLVPLYNNRANTRLKDGNGKEAVDDSSKVISIILQSPSGVVVGGKVDFAALDEEELPAEAKEINLKDQLGKALGRRAKAYEVVEKWGKALEDWSCLMGGGEAFTKSAGGAKVVSEGVTRCRKMVAGENAPTPAATAPAQPQRPQATRTAKPTPRPAAPIVPSGEALAALRTASKAQSAEDDLRFSLKDSVDTKLTAWKGGKETNLRALIASLENVLWAELEWKKIGMHELISEGQLKVRYMKAIAKVHPDKLAVGQFTVEQRMIAGGVFSALNDAWNAART